MNISYITNDVLLLIPVLFSFYLYAKTKHPGTLLIAISGVLYITELIAIYTLLYSNGWPGYIDIMVSIINPILIALLFAIGFSKLTIYLTKKHHEKII